MRREVWMRGSYVIIRVGAGQVELGTVRATSTAAALRIGAKRFGIQVGLLDAVEVLPPVRLRRA